MQQRSSTQHEQFIGEPIEPAAGTFDSAAMSHGEPGLPATFTWRGREYHVLGIIEKWKTSGPCRNGADEMYLRRHWWRIASDDQAVFTIYCDRQAKDRKHPKARWWVYGAAIKGGNE